MGRARGWGPTYRPIYNVSDSDSSGTLAELKGCRSRWVPTLLTHLHGSAFTPEVDSCRVGYVEGTNKGDPNAMTMMELHDLAKSFPWPKGIKLRLPCKNGGSQANYPGCIVVHEEVLEAGFRLPLHPFICDFLSDTKLCPVELTPNAWRAILAFLLKFKDLNLVPSYEAFKYMYAIRYIRARDGISYNIRFPGVNLISIPDNPSLWERKWFLVCQSEEFHFDFPMYPGNRRFTKDSPSSWDKKKGVKIENEVQELVKIFKSLPKKPGLLSHKIVLDVSRLEEAGLSLPHPVFITERGGPVDIHVQYIAERKRKAGCFGDESKRMELANKKAKTCLPHLKDLASNKYQPEEEEEEEEEEDPDEEPEEEEEDLEEEEKDLEEELTGTNTQDMLSEDAPISSAHVDRDEEVSGEAGKVDAPLEGGCEWTSSIRTLCRPEVSTALRQLPEILLAAQHSKELELQLDESRREIVHLKRENAELQSRIERLELEKHNLMEVTEKAREFVELSSSLLKVKN